MRHYFWKSLLPVGLCFAILFDGLLPVASAQTVAPARINVVVVAGEGAATNIRQRVATDPAVRIEDDDQQPVAGAAVVFALPVSGASGEFTDGAKTLTVLTDKTGVATARGLKTNEIPGKLQIYVTASYRGLRATGIITQTVQGVPGMKIPEARTSSGGGKWKWVLLGIVAAAGAGAGIYLKGRKSGSSTTPTTSINTGTVVFGSPR